MSSGLPWKVRPQRASDHFHVLRERKFDSLICVMLGRDLLLGGALLVTPLAPLGSAGSSTAPGGNAGSVHAERRHHAGRQRRLRRHRRLRRGRGPRHADAAHRLDRRARACG